MSDITSREVFIRVKNYPSRLSVQRSGIWGFENYANYVITHVIEGVSYYKMPFNFGVCFSNQFNPAILAIIGNAGDYLAVEQSGILSILTEEKFLQQNPNLVGK